jgi:hypothetical protein
LRAFAATAEVARFTLALAFLAGDFRFGAFRVAIV